MTIAAMPVKAVASNLSLNRASDNTASYAERLRRRSQQIPGGGTLPRVSQGRKSKIEAFDGTLSRASSRASKMPNMYGFEDSDSETSQSTIKLDRNGNVAVVREDGDWNNEDSDTLGRRAKQKNSNRPSLNDVQWRSPTHKSSGHYDRSTEIRTAPSSRANSVAQLQTSNGSVGHGSSKDWVLAVGSGRTSSRTSAYHAATLERMRSENSYASTDPGKFASISSRNSLRRRQSSTTRSITSTRSTQSHLVNSSRPSQAKGMIAAPTLLSEHDLLQVRIMYQSHSSQVIVCRCLANIYFSDNDERTNRRGNRNWELIFTGVPVLLLDMGDSRCRLNRRLHIILAEKGTGFALWRDSVDTFSKYKEVERTFHTMLQSSNHRKLIGFSFDNAFAATEFHSHLKEFLCDPENILLWRDQNSSKKKDNKSSKVDRSVSFHGSQSKRQWLKKVQISTPCCFQHITCIRPSDLMNPDQFSRDGSALNLRMSLTSRSPSTETFPKRSTASQPFIGHSVV